jgi:hypothetical protein
MKQYALSLTSAFTSTSLIQSRIVMIYQQSSNRIALRKFLWAIPVLALCLFVASLMQEKTNANPLPTPQNEYQVLSVLSANANTETSVQYPLHERYEYALQFVNKKTKKIIAPPSTFTLFISKDKQASVKELAQTLYYAPKGNEMHTLELHNTHDFDVEIQILFKEKPKTPKMLQTYPVQKPFSTPTKEEGC